MSDFLCILLVVSLEILLMFDIMIIIYLDNKRFDYFFKLKNRLYLITIMSFIKLS